MAAPESDLRLPHECWESIFKFLLINDGGERNHRYLESLSLVCKQFLSITNHLRFSLTICDPILPFLPHLFQRFPNLTSLNLTRFEGDIDALLTQISTFPLHLKSLKISNQSTIPANGLRAFAKKITSLTSLTCSNIHKIRIYDLILISDCFPMLEELDLSDPRKVYFELNSMFFVLPKLRKVNLSGHYYINDSLFLNLCKNCEFLEEIVMLKYPLLSHDGIAFAIRERLGLRSLSVRLSSFIHNDNIHNHSLQFIDSLVSLKSLTCLDLSFSFILDESLLAIAEHGLPLRKLVLEGCFGYSCVGLINLVSKCRYLQYLDLDSAEFLNDGHVLELSRFLGDLVSININRCGSLTSLALFALLRNCAKLNEVRMENTSIGKMSVENSSTLMNFVVYPHLKSLYLGRNTWLGDEGINMFASVFPNLQLLDLSFSNGISEEGIGQVLRKCSKIRHLTLAYSGQKLPKMKFNVFMLEVLNLTHTRVDDEALHLISKSCSGLLQLDLSYCHDVTEKGVMQVIENCTQLREITLHDCCKVSAGPVDLMVFMRPSLRKITTPPGFCCSDSKRKLFLRHGCLVC